MADLLTSKDSTSRELSSAWRVAALYGLVSVSWIAITELLYAYAGEKLGLTEEVFHYRGWIFSTGSVVIVYWIVRSQLATVSQMQTEASAQSRAARAASLELANERMVRDRTEQALAASTRELQDLNFALNQSAIVAATDRRGIITFVNDSFCRISKYSREELLGQDHRIINSGKHPPEFFRQLWETILSGRVWHGQICNRAKDGSAYWVDTTIIPFRSAAGEIYQFMAIRHDITERKLAEEKLFERENLARLGEMAAVVAHEVKNPLAGISGALQVLATRFPEASRERQICHEIVKRADSLADKLHDMLVFARPRNPSKAPVTAEQIIAETMRQVASDPVFRTVEIKLEIASLTLNVDAALIGEVVLNLMLNSAQAMNGNGQIALRARNGSPGFGAIEIEDSGPGVPEHLQKDIFKPFVTTKNQGTGLGLAVARRVAVDHGGDLRLHPATGRGACFVIELPLATKP